MNGLGFAAMRDFNACLRYERSATTSATPNPLAGDVTRIYTEISSQPGRLLNDFRHLGFNQAENGQEGVRRPMQWIAAGDGINMNYRFSQPGRTERNRQDQLYRGGRVPVRQRDDAPIPITGKTDSRYERCTATEHLPAGDGDLLGERVLGQGGVAAAHRRRTARTICRTRRSRATTSSRATSTARATRRRRALPAVPEPARFGAGAARAVHRARRVGDERHAAAASRVPRLPTARSCRRCRRPGGLPDIIPGRRPTPGLKTTRYLLQLRPQLLRRRASPTINPPRDSRRRTRTTRPTAPIYPSFVPKTDSDGNDIAGVRLPDVTVPLATYTGWALRARRRRRTTDAKARASASRSRRPKADRAGSGDPRPSVEERYPTFERTTRSAVRARSTTWSSTG